MLGSTAVLQWVRCRYTGHALGKAKPLSAASALAAHHCLVHPSKQAGAGRGVLVRVHTSPHSQWPTSCSCRPGLGVGAVGGDAAGAQGAQGAAGAGVQGHGRELQHAGGAWKESRGRVCCLLICSGVHGHGRELQHAGGGAGRLVWLLVYCKAYLRWLLSGVGVSTAVIGAGATCGQGLALLRCCLCLAARLSLTAPQQF